MSGARRQCEVCGSTVVKLIYNQRFSPIDGAGLVRGYDVVVCRECGFGYADGIPDQAAFDAYYRDFSKYESRDSNASDADVERLSEAAGLIREFVPSRTARILEIGCATGTLLGLLRSAGYENLAGIDASPACAEAARREHGVPVAVGSLFDSTLADASYDCVITTGVLEHIRDLSRAVVRISSLLADGGKVLSAVPDATRFAVFTDAPFQEFSIEHINFFSPPSLASLFRKFGFKRVCVRQGFVSPSCGTTSAVIYDSYERTKGGTSPQAPIFDSSTEVGLIAYVQQCRDLDRELRNAIDRLVSARQPLVVWGVGTHTQRLLANTNLREANVVAFIDSNPNYHGRTLNGVQIMPPERVRDFAEPILVSSRRCQDAILRQIRLELGLSNEVLTLYNLH